MTTAPNSHAASRCARNLPQHFNGCACRASAPTALEVIDVELVRSSTPSRDFSDVTHTTAVPDDINSWDVVDRVAFYDALEDARNAAWDGFGPRRPSPAREIELKYSRIPTHPAEPSPAFPVDPRYWPAGRGVAECPGCDGKGAQYTTIGDRTCFLCEGGRVVDSKKAHEFIRDVRKFYGGDDHELDYEAMMEDRAASSLSGYRDQQERRDYGIY